ncbi:hypothetical protein Hokovirus_2_28 [Hokovirus HKV1]|uniref:Uncharacterized protein n=1 Tax=Hokovirus HKV1 TaxID=1977638 RepID=A0A1V0SFP6_9VIRU|nr:hypothetical protein Hokovirus_2_28 [Hokovirus HKV1]
MEFKILKLHSYDPIKNTFTTRKTGTLDDLEISVDQLFDAYDIIIARYSIIRNTSGIVSKILEGQNFFLGNHSVYGVNPVYINNKLEKYTYWNSNSVFPYAYPKVRYAYCSKSKVIDYHLNNERYTFFRDKLPCIFIDYYSDIHHLRKYYKITELELHIYYIEEKGLLTKAAIKK